MFLAIPFEVSVLCMIKKTAFVTKTVSDSGLVQLPAWAHFLISPYSVDVVIKPKMSWEYRKWSQYILVDSSAP